MRISAILILAVLTILLLGCGGGSDGADATVKKTSAVESQGDTQVINIVGKADFTLDPNVFELKIGQPYQITFDNQGTRSFKFRIPRWDISLFVRKDGEPASSDVFVPKVPGTYDCFEDFFAAREKMDCDLTVVE